MILNKGNEGRHRRRGSIYITILGASTIVMVIGLSAVTVIRIERRFATVSTDFAQARLYAQSAVELAYSMMRDDPNWRTNRSSGIWLTDQTLGDGTFTLQVVDPVDNDYQTDPFNSVLITGAGMQGDATFKLEVTLAAQDGGWVVADGSWRRVVN